MTDYNDPPGTLIPVTLHANITEVVGAPSTLPSAHWMAEAGSSKYYVRDAG